MSYGKNKTYYLDREYQDGIAVPDFGGDGKDAERKKEREQIYAVLREAALHYVKNLALPEEWSGGDRG